MNNFATVDDIKSLWRSLTADEEKRAETLLTTVSASLRAEADRVGKDLDEMINEKDFLKEVAKSVTVDVFARILNTSTTAEPMSQMSQSAGGYSVSGTYLIPGGGLFIKKSELARLGLRKQRYGVIELWKSEE